MPTSKRVHFLDPVTNAVLSPAPFTPAVTPHTPRTPSPTYSGSSLSSFSPSTPPTSIFHPSPIGTSTGNDIRIHPVIASSINSTPYLHFDVALSPSMLLSPNSSLSGFQRVSSSITRPSHVAPAGFDPAVLNDPATYPPLSSITLVSDLLPWSIHVEASQAFPAPVVTIYDVLQTLYITLHIPIVPCEWTYLPQTTQRLVSTAFYGRLGSIPGHHSRESEKSKGVRRMDFLTGRTRLLGLTPVVDKPGLFAVSWGAREV